MHSGFSLQVDNEALRHMHTWNDEIDRNHSHNQFQLRLPTNRRRESTTSSGGGGGATGSSNAVAGSSTGPGTMASVTLASPTESRSTFSDGGTPGEFDETGDEEDEESPSGGGRDGFRGRNRHTGRELN